jgi:hypothetical protein
MKHAIPTHLSDTELIDGLARSVRGERGATVHVVAHLAEMDARRLHLGAGFPSLFAYCCEVLRLSESATCKRIDVARAARRHPVILDRLAEGSLNLTTARLIAPHLTDANHVELVAAASGLRSRAVEELVARRFPKPDVAALVRKLPAPRAATIAPGPTPAPLDATPAAVPGVAPLPALPSLPSLPSRPSAPALPSRPSATPQWPLATPLSADRYQIRFTANASTWRKLQAARDLLRHAVPSGDPGEIFDRALTALLEEAARRKCARVATPAAKQRATAAGSRHVPAKVRRAVWLRDQARCAFVTPSGRRCGERGRLEFHHVEPFGTGGAATVANIQLRCRAHNAYESVLFYGEAKAFRRDSAVRESSAAYRESSAAYREHSASNLSPRGSTGRAAGKSCELRGDEPAGETHHGPPTPCLSILR